MWTKLKERAKELKLAIPAIYVAMKHPKTPRLAKVIGVVVIVYALSPIDLIPDFIPIFGFLDDLIILPILIAWMLRLIKAPLYEECKQMAMERYGGSLQTSWWYSIPFLVFWALILGWVLSTIL
ncbi:MAG: YkvA family protein [bacterium]|jgi:uncharacterized membrane protein YkvA (DUF1232 family)|nr:YkvA family protein [bacterium]